VLENRSESRLSVLESKIVELNKVILRNNDNNPLKERRNNGLGAIRTPELVIQGSCSKLEPLYSFFTTDCQPVKEIQTRNDKGSNGDLCTSCTEDLGSF